MQQVLIEGASNTDRIAIEPASISSVGVRYEIAIDGRDVTGELLLDKPNPYKRRKADVKFAAPASWTDEHHAAALRIAAHWFRDIGEFGHLVKKHLCQVVQRLSEGRTEHELHAAIATYASSEWHRDGCKWTRIGRFFDTRYSHFETWIAKSAKKSRCLQRSYSPGRIGTSCTARRWD